MNATMAIKARKSTRKYKDSNVNKELMAQVKQDLEEFAPIFSKAKVRFEILNSLKETKNAKLGFLWGIGKINAPCCIVGICEDMDEGMKEIGFALEQEVLKITEAGYGTCWLGTFNAKALSDKCKLTDKEKIGVVVAVGVAKEDGFMNTQFRQIAGSTKRKSIQEICLNHNDKNLDSQIIEMMELSILAPSANNMQPVRVAIENNRADFYLKSDSSVDVGIFMSHFYLCAIEKYKEVKVSVEEPKSKCYNVDDSSIYAASIIFQ